MDPLLVVDKSYIKDSFEKTEILLFIFLNKSLMHDSLIVSFHLISNKPKKIGNPSDQRGLGFFFRSNYLLAGTKLFLSSR